MHDGCHVTSLPLCRCGWREKNGNFTSTKGHKCWPRVTNAVTLIKEKEKKKQKEERKNLNSIVGASRWQTRRVATVLEPFRIAPQEPLCLLDVILWSSIVCPHCCVTADREAELSHEKALLLVMIRLLLWEEVADGCCLNSQLFIFLSRPEGPHRNRIRYCGKVGLTAISGLMYESEVV